MLSPWAPPATCRLHPGPFIARCALPPRFATQERNALLLYNGRFNEKHDFIALEIVDEQVQLTFSAGKASRAGGSRPQAASQALCWLKPPRPATAPSSVPIPGSPPGRGGEVGGGIPERTKMFTAALFIMLQAQLKRPETGESLCPL